MRFRAALTRPAIEMLHLEKEGIVRDQFLRLFLRKKGTRQLYLDVEKFDRFQDDFDLEE